MTISQKKDKLNNLYGHLKNIFGFVLVAFFGLSGWIFVNIESHSFGALQAVACMCDVALVMLLGVLQHQMNKVNEKIGEL